MTQTEDQVQTKHIRQVRQYRMVSREIITHSQGWDVAEVVRSELKRRLAMYLLDHDLRPISPIDLQIKLLKKNPKHDPNLVYSPLHIEADDNDWEFWRMEATVQAVRA